MTSPLLNVEGGPAQGAADVRYGFFTDTSICIGCKACEVACKEWNGVPAADAAFSGHSLDNTGALGADAWRHVLFIEQPGQPGEDPQPVAGLEWFGDDPDPPPAFGGVAAAPGSGFRWLMASDVCKHCDEAACLEVCPTGAIFYTEFDTVVVQDNVCNGCGYCVTACPYGVIERRESDGGAFKCTLCYDRMKGGKQPACAAACPTDSIQFGPLPGLRERAATRVDDLVAAGHAGAQLYGADPDDGVGGNHCFFLLLDDPEVYRLPPDPVTPRRHLGQMWKAAGVAAGALAAGIAAAVAGADR
jgi:formate dehydrogenase iron-sulfur subunit